MRAITMKNRPSCAARFWRPWPSAVVAVGRPSAGELKLTMQDGRVTHHRRQRAAAADPAGMGARRPDHDRQRREAERPERSRCSWSTRRRRDALDILLRSASGYIAAPRPVPVANAAFYDRVTIMATSRAPAAAPRARRPPPTFQRPPTRRSTTATSRSTSDDAAAADAARCSAESAGPVSPNGIRNRAAARRQMPPSSCSPAAPPMQRR